MARAVTVLGTGRMGAAMARKLTEAGHDVRVWNRTAATAEALAVDVPGLRVAPDPADAVAGADVVISVLASGDVTVGVLLEESVVTALNPEVVVVDHGTSGVEATRRLSDGLTAAGRRFVDGPVSGSVPTVLAGQLLVMAAGAAGDVADVTPVLSAYARGVAHVGDVGAGQVMKLAVNLVVHTLNAAVGEALSLTGRTGIDPAAAYDVMQDSVVGAPFVRYKRDAFMDPTTPVAMSIDLTVKDLGLIRDLAAELGTTLPVGEAVSELYRSASRAGRGAEDMAAIARFLRDVRPVVE